MKRLILFVAFALCFGSAAARADCAAASMNDFEDVYCFAKSYIAADDALNAAYKALTPKLDANAKSVLKKGQLTWLKKRNDECGESGSDGYSVDLSCAVELTKGRTQFLQDREKECASGACDLAKLAEVE